jgi:hypothetical protein
MTLGAVIAFEQFLGGGCVHRGACWTDTSQGKNDRYECEVESDSFHFFSSVRLNIKQVQLIGEN